MAVYNCFTFFNELDLLEIHLAELASVVDTFVIAESPITFQGKPKPLVFKENQARFRKFAKQIRHIVVDDTPITTDPWDRERHQRNALKRGLTDAAQDSTVIISDVDEIPTRSTVLELESRRDFTYIQMKLFVYFLNFEVIGGADVPWIKVYGGPWRSIQTMPDLTAPREGEPRDYLKSRNIHDLDAHLIEGGGWHFSWQGSPERLIEKLDAFSHTEEQLQRWRDPEGLAHAIAQRRFFTSGSDLSIRPIEELPITVQNSRNRYLREGLLAPAPQRQSLIATLFADPGAPDRPAAALSIYKKCFTNFVRTPRWMRHAQWLWSLIWSHE